MQLVDRLFAGRSGVDVQLEDCECERVEALEEARVDAEDRYGLFFSAGCNDVQEEDCECERVEAVDETRVEGQDRSGLPLSAEFNGGNLLQLKDPLRFFKTGETG